MKESVKTAKKSLKFQACDFFWGVGKQKRLRQRSRERGVREEGKRQKSRSVKRRRRKKEESKAFKASNNHSKRQRKTFPQQAKRLLMPTYPFAPYLPTYQEDDGVGIGAEVCRSIKHVIAKGSSNATHAPN